MNGLFFCTYLHAFDGCYNYEENYRATLVEELLCSCVSGSERESFRYAIDTNTSTITQYFSGKRIPPDPIRRGRFQSKDIGKYIYDYFDEVIIEKIPEPFHNVVKGRIVQLIKKDRTMSVEKKDDLLCEAEESDISIFLADALIYAVIQPKPEDNFKFHFPNPPVNNLPNIHSSHFTGRDDELADIKKCFEDGRQYVSLSGISGSGKTQLALEYALCEFDSYDYIWWLNCTTEESILASYAEIAQKLKLGNKDSDPQCLMREVQSWCQANGFWLMILDNIQYGKVNHPYDLKCFLPPITKTGHVLFTALNDAPYGDEEIIHVSLFDADRGSAFVRERLNLAEDSQGVEKLVTRLGGLPLALEEACAYISANSGETLGTYIDKLDKYHVGFGDELFYNNTHEQTLLEVTSLAIDQVRKAQSKKLLATISYFSEGGMNAGLIRLARPIEGSKQTMPPALAELFADDLQLQKTVKPLREMSLVNPDYGDEDVSARTHLGMLQQIYCHKLTQEIVRENFDSNGEGALLGLELCTEAIRYCSAMTGDYYSLIPDILAFLENAERKLREQTDAEILKKVTALYRYASWALDDDDERQSWIWDNHIYFTEKAYGYKSIQAAYTYLEYFELFAETKYPEGFMRLNDACLLLCEMSEEERKLKHPLYEKRDGYPSLCFGESDDIIGGYETLGGFRLLTAIIAGVSIVSDRKDKGIALKYSNKQRNWLKSYINHFAKLWNAQADEDDGGDINPESLIQQIEENILELKT